MSDQYVGEIRMFAGKYAPKDWAFCDGSLLSINGNEMLYSLIGVTYGGDGQTNFKLPDLRGRIPISLGQNPQTGTTYAAGQAGGVEKVTLISDQLPAHTHAVNAQSSTTGAVDNPTNAFWAGSATKQYTKSNPNAVMSTNAIDAVGGGQPHDNMMPYLVVSFIIAVNGLYPSQG